MSRIRASRGPPSCRDMRHRLRARARGRGVGCDVTAISAPVARGWNRRTERPAPHTARTCMPEHRETRVGVREAGCPRVHPRQASGKGRRRTRLKDAWPGHHRPMRERATHMRAARHKPPAPAQRHFAAASGDSCHPRMCECRSRRKCRVCRTTASRLLRATLAEMPFAVFCACRRVKTPAAG
jgi:hypothetical protein